MRRLTPILLVLASTACVRQEWPVAPSSWSATFSGKVIDLKSGAGVPGAVVQFGTSSAVTDAAGTYTIALRYPASFDPRVNGGFVGSIAITTANYRGDFFVNTGACVGRYGVLTDRDTGEPIDGVDVFLGASPSQHATTDLAGWYRVDAGCPSGGIIGFNTTLIYFSRSGYADSSSVVGRGLSGYHRLDWSISRIAKTVSF